MKPLFRTEKEDPQDGEAILRVKLLNDLAGMGTARKVKEELLREHDFLKEVFALTYDWRRTYGIRKLPPVKKGERPSTGANRRWLRFKDILDSLASRELSGNAAYDALSGLFARCQESEAEWYGRIVRGDLRIGVGMGTILKVWPGLIPIWCVPLAEKVFVDSAHGAEGTSGRVLTLSQLKYPVAVDSKYDGIRLTVQVEKGVAVARTRSGHEYPHLDHITDAIAKMGDGFYDGEVMGERWNDTSSLMGLDPSKPGAIERIRKLNFHIFDHDGLEPFGFNLLQRRARLSILMHRHPNDALKLVKLTMCHNADDVLACYRRALGQGYEGVMVKRLAGGWIPGRSTDWLKLKPIVTSEAEVIGFYAGTGRNAHRLGGFIVSHKDHELRVGGGYDDWMRDEWWENRESFLGRIMEFKAQDDPTQVALGRFCVFKRWRGDLAVAD